jgi:hypothetical protein
MDGTRLNFFLFIENFFMKKLFFLLVSSLFLLNGISAQTDREVWPKEKAWQWYESKGWLRGCDFIPSTAINQLEMWQKETFDSTTINRELGYAESIGFNCVRVYLHHLAWEQDNEGFLDRMKTYLGIADRHHIKTIFVFFDDVWNEVYHAGKQPDPKPGVHNSGWVRDPGKLWYENPALAVLLERYVKDVMTTFADDERVLLWDLYNEPGNSGYGNKSMSLLRDAFGWGREVNPSQPLSAGVWSPELTDLNTYQLAESDVITYHDYQSQKKHEKTIDTLKKYDRPMLCTEYMARPRGSTFYSIMPMLKRNNIAAINWGLVDGKTNTKYAWDTPIPSGRDPKLWFHDIFHKDGTPYKRKEIEFIRKQTMTNANAPKTSKKDSKK